MQGQDLSIYTLPPLFLFPANERVSYKLSADGLTGHALPDRCQESLMAMTLIYLSDQGENDEDSGRKPRLGAEMTREE